MDPIYVFHSEHPILIERAVAELRDEAVPPAARGFNYDVVEGKPKASQIVALAQTLPMMAKMRMVFVRDLSLMPADEGETLLEYVARPNPSTVVVALASKLDKRLKLFAQLSKKGFLHVLEAPRQLAAWVRDEAKARGVKLDADAMRRLVDTVGDDVSRLALSIEQLGLYTAGKPVTSDDVDDLIAETRERSLFELGDAIGAADRTWALTVVGSLCDRRESAIGAIGLLARHVRQLSLLHHLRRQQVPRSEWAKRIGVPPFVLDKLMSQAQRYTPRALQIATRRLATADRALKGDITLTADTSPFTGPQLKVLGRELTERVVLEQLVDGIVRLAS
jgi:DNA polymerase-3 subunit delta